MQCCCNFFFYHSMEWKENSTASPYASAAPQERNHAFVSSMFPSFAVTAAASALRQRCRYELVALVSKKKTNIKVLEQGHETKRKKTGCESKSNNTQIHLCLRVIAVTGLTGVANTVDCTVPDWGEAGIGLRADPKVSNVERGDPYTPSSSVCSHSTSLTVTLLC